MPHNDDINIGHEFVFYGTNSRYTGKVIQIGDTYFTTKGGGIEGDREQVTLVTPTTGNVGNDLIKKYASPSTALSSTTDTNPIINLFIRGDGSQFDRAYQYPDGGNVPNGVELHVHQDGTVMTKHSMGPNDNSQIVTPIGSMNSIQRGRMNVARQVSTTTRSGGAGMRGTTTRGGSTGGSTGGGGGGGY